MFSKVKVIAAVLALVLVSLTSQSAYAGAYGGIRSGYYRVPGGYTSTFRIPFRGGESAAVAIVGDGSTNLDLYIYDSYGNLVAWDEGWSDRCSASWYPTYSDTFTIMVVNRGLFYNDYGLGTN